MPFVVLLVPFFVIVAAFVLVGLSQTHTAQHGSTGIKGFIDDALGNSIAAQLFGLGKKAARSLVSRYAASHLKMLTAYLHGMAHLWKGEFQATQDFARSSNRLARTTERAIPREAHKAAAPAMARAKVANRHAEHALAQGRTTSRELHRFRTRTHAQLRHDAHAIDVTIPRDIGHVRRREEELSRSQAKLRERTTSLENGAVKAFEWIRAHPFSAVTGVFAGAVAVALARLGFDFLRCRNWRNVGRRITCGMGAWLGALLDLIATFALSLLGVLNPDVLARVTVHAVDAVEPHLESLLRTTTNEAEIEKDVERLVRWLGLG